MLPTYKGFKKTADDKEKATLSHENGHQITIVKKGLSKPLRKQLDELPLHQAEGSEVPISDTEVETDQIQPAVPGQNILSQKAAPVLSTPEGPANAAQEPAPQAPVSPEQALKDATPFSAQGLQAAQEEKAANQQYGKDVVSTEQEHQKLLSDASTDLQLDLAKTRNEHDAIMKDLQDPKQFINPNQYLENMSTGKKIATAIGLVLGGMGSAKTGGPNPAMQFLNQQIERNLQAQQANRSSKQNLLSALEKQYGDKIVAANMFRSINADKMASDLQIAAANHQAALANPQYHMALMGLQQQAAQYQNMADIAHLRNNLKNTEPGPQQDAKAQVLLQHLRTRAAMGDQASAGMAKEIEQKYVPGIGVGDVELSGDDKQELEARKNLGQTYDKARDYMKDTSNLGLGAIGPTEHGQGDVLQTQLATHAGVLNGLKRFTPLEDKYVRAAAPGLTGTHFTGADNIKIDTASKINDMAYNNLLKAKGLPGSADDFHKVKVMGPDGKVYDATRSQLKSLPKGYKPI